MVIVDGKAVPNGLSAPSKAGLPRDIHSHIFDKTKQQSGVKQKQALVDDPKSQQHSRTKALENSNMSPAGLRSPTDGTNQYQEDNLDQVDNKGAIRAQRSHLGRPGTTTKDEIVPESFYHNTGNTRNTGLDGRKQAHWTELGREWTRNNVFAIRNNNNADSAPTAVDLTHHNGQNAHDRDRQRNDGQTQRIERGTTPVGTFDQPVAPDSDQHDRGPRKQTQQHSKSNGVSVISNERTNGHHEPNPNPKKKLILNAFVEMCSGHQSPGLWRHPDDRSSEFNSIKHWVDLAQLLEKGHFHGMFIADVLGGYDVYGGPQNLTPAIRSGAQWPVNEPLSIVPAMAAATESLGFGITISTSYEQPYHLARRISTVDHLTQGRIGWNVVTGYLDSAARNLTHGQPQAPHDQRYAIAEEYMTVVYKLWNSSWRTDAVQLNRQTGIYTDPTLVRSIDHAGKHFTVPGPHICAPSPQRTPVIMQAGTSSSGKAFASKHAELIFVSAHTPSSIAPAITDIRSSASQLGRDPNQIKVLAKFCPVLARTQEAAEAKYREYIPYGDHEGALALFGGWTGVDLARYGDDEELRYVESNAIRSYIEGLLKSAPDVNGGKWTKRTLAEHIIVGGLGATCVGTPEMVADEMERWVKEGGVDGFNIAYALLPQTFEDVIDLLIPELRKRGLFWDGYCVPGGTYRENLFEMPGQHEPLPDHPAAKMIWRADSDGSASGMEKDGVKDAVEGNKSMTFAHPPLNGTGEAFKGDGKTGFDSRDLVDAVGMQLG